MKINLLSVLVSAFVVIIGITGLAFIRPDKAAELAIPIAIVVCGLAGPRLAGTWLGAVAMGGLLGVIDVGVLTVLSRTLSLPDKLMPITRFAASVGFAIAPALGTFLWVQYQRKHPK